MKHGLKILFSKDSSFIKMLVKRVPELATIIISILLALSIESWADNRKDHKKLRTYYENISSEILRDTTAMTEIMDDAQKRIDDMKKFGKLIRDYKTEYKDSIQTFCTSMITVELFNSSSMISYQSMVLSGDFKLIENINIREKLIALDEEYTTLKILEDLYMDFFQQELVKGVRRVSDSEKTG